MNFKTELTYKGRPLVRSADELYYGDLDGKYILKLKILSTKKQGDVDVADRVQILLLDSDFERPEAERIMRSTERAGLFTALDIGKVWLDSALHLS